MINTKRMITTKTATVVIGLAIAAIGLVGVVRTFDPVQLSATQGIFWLATLLGFGIATGLHRD